MNNSTTRTLPVPAALSSVQSKQAQAEQGCLPQPLPQLWSSLPSNDIEEFGAEPQPRTALIH